MTKAELLALGMSEEMATQTLALHETGVSGLKKSKQEILSEKKLLKEQMEKVKNLDPTKYLEMQNKLKVFEEKDLEDGKNWERLKEILTNDHNEVIKKYETTNSNLLNQLEAKTLNSLKSDFIKKGANPDTVDGLIALEKSRGNLKFSFEDGIAKTFLGDKEIKTEGDKIHGIDEYFENSENKAWMSTKGNNGSGFNAGSGGKTPDKPLKDWSIQEKIDFTKEHGSEKYQELLGKQEIIKKE